jgi:hypothetical protein
MILKNKYILAFTFYGYACLLYVSAQKKLLGGFIMAEVGHWRIYINLPEDRGYKGSLSLYNEEGNYVFGCDCLGRGSNYEVIGGDHWDWWLSNADTPTGDYEGSIIGPKTPASKFGPYDRVNMVALYKGDHADIAAHSGDHRSGIMIHGGDLETNPSTTWYPLKPTLGCIRVSNDDQETLTDLISSYGGSGLVQVRGVQKEKS